MWWYIDDNILRRALSKLRYHLNKQTKQYPQLLCTDKKILGKINYILAIELGKTNDMRYIELSIH